MKLSDFLHISQSTIQENESLIILLDRFEYDYTAEVESEVIAQIKKTPALFWVKLTIVNSVIDGLCKSTALDSHWKMILETIKSNGSLLQRPYQSEPSIHCLELIKGMILYNQYKIERVVNPTDATDYLLKSAELGCFLAINILCNNTLGQTNPGLDLNEVDKLLSLCQKAATLHWTPGYLLLSNVCLELVSIVDEKFKGTFVSFSYRETYLTQALTALYFAEYFESFSGSSINNAYNGRSLADVYKDTWLVNITLARSHLLVRYPELNKMDQVIKEKTKFDFDKIARQYNLKPAQYEPQKVLENSASAVALISRAS